MRAAVQRHDHLRIGQPVERQGPRQRHHMPAIDQPFAIGTVRGVKMHLGGVLPQAGGQHMLGLLDRDPVNMVDHLAYSIITQTVRLSGQCKIIAAKIQPCGNDQVSGGNKRREVRHNRPWRGSRPALTHHHPAHIAQHICAMLVAARRADPDHP